MVEVITDRRTQEVLYLLDPKTGVESRGELNYIKVNSTLSTPLKEKRIMVSDYDKGLKEPCDYVEIPPCGYVAIPIETMERVGDLVNEARAFLYVGNTNRVMIALDKVVEELKQDE